ncbi:malto-oligosyltrehalose synthase [Mucilaginibacter sp. KACC 22063]|uniref:malto-oligosyltrehalose synthase n=1 Tax=Mucilaginibacter sp. KACC 22063 TaxID=3025666 RepID=UPI002365E4C6|nr:malto-oligosyltrehalose synthase [Mucilaginibacter sp. KACC 22063]WDF54032.1 malto-oligosyltrehalose synthase [Mucilaginibacter sp. KACC 22063]
MYNPVATYRLQFHKEFTFNDFEQIISYLQKFGVKTIYASPVFKSVPGSTHGYDGIDPTQINPEIGNDRQLSVINKKLKEADIGWLQDIVPNHMGVHADNAWLNDVLEKGKQSAFASFFDTGLTNDLYNDVRIMMPSLGKPLDEVIKDNELQLAYENKRLVFKYYDNYWPLNIQSYSKLLSNGLASETVQKGVKALNKLQRSTDTASLSTNWQNWLNTQAKNTEMVAAVNEAIAAANQNQELLTELAGLQYYRLCSWQETDTNINYRRFFTVNTLMCINIQDEAVFTKYHSFIKKLVSDGTFQGLRIDHIDGLYDPEKYLQNLRQLAGDETYIVAEKILEQGEELPSRWPIQGTTGYDFLAQLNNLLTDSSSEKKFTAFYNRLTGDTMPVYDQILQKKAYILFTHMQGELENLTNYLFKLKLAGNSELKGIGKNIFKNAIAQVLIHCPVYRFYGNSLPLVKEEADALEKIFTAVIKEHKELKPAIDALATLLLEKPKEGNGKLNDKILRFYQRLMQFSGPLMAKGVEDTLMYTYNRFVAHNEVGDAPDAFGMDTKAFHKLMKQRQKLWPLALNGTSTHDTKRGEDVRTRLNVLTAVPELWLDAVKEWEQLAQGANAPTPGDRYFIYQTILGAYPMPGQPEDDFANRLGEYLTKALREGKTNSDWADPNEDYEQATLNFANKLLDQQGSFWQSFNNLFPAIADHGIINSLSQVLLKFTCPGVPDVYQGCELWDLSMVDPDNRRPVDYELRNQLLSKQLPADVEEKFLQLWENRYDGHIKLWLTHQLFKIRDQESDLFANGEYIPLKIKGAYKENVIAFARRYKNQWLIVAAPLYTAAITSEQISTINIDWKDTRIILPAETPDNWQNLLTQKSGSIKNESIDVNTAFEIMPLALLMFEQPENDRGSGILMHITSLPSAFGIGDVGPAAKTFANFLSTAGQKYWQLLPLNPTGADQQYSPYSSGCSMAGNALLISPILLAKDGLLTEAELSAYHLPVTDKVDYTKAEENKKAIFAKAWQNFKSGKFQSLNKNFQAFCEKEAFWLNDYALYSAIKHANNEQPWYQWPKDLKSRNANAIVRAEKLYAKEINYFKWLQFMFFRQWHQLKNYCHTLNIQLFGDLPFYVSYDSSDVWANQQYFALDRQGNMTGIAGVPPDYFSEDGQLWGMPVYRWDILKQNGYQWWISRLQKNMELFDLLRLDHFRAFSAFWQVPAGETTARNGKWVQGPAGDFFNAVKQALGNLPFVAEDLGDIDEPVFTLRDEFALPGMKVLQFAFGDTMPQSLYIPHNYQPNFFVYTGTHDNNTTIGWFNQDVNTDIIKQIGQYTGIAPKQKNIGEILMRMAYASTAKVAILPMQDVLALDERSRMNNPSQQGNNWQWRMLPKLVEPDTAADLLRLVKMYNRQ